MDFTILAFVVLIFSLIQSIFGLGLLVFGTPTLMILGYSFQETLSFVLPASIVISILQIKDSRRASKSFQKDFNIYCLPFVLIGVTSIIISRESFDLSLMIGAVLIFSSAVNYYKRLGTFLTQVIKKNRGFYLILMGFIHGLTNMGGGLLALFSSVIHDKDKEKTRSGVAYGYFLMGSIQYTLLLFFNPQLFKLKALALMILSATTYLLLGKKLFLDTKQKVFQNAITGITFAYGVVLIVK